MNSDNEDAQLNYLLHFAERNGIITKLVKVKHADQTLVGKKSNPGTRMSNENYGAYLFAYQLPRRPPRRPSWTCACGNCASYLPSSHYAWPNGGTPSSCRPSWRTPCGARNVSWAPWFKRLGTTGSKQLLRTRHSGEATHKKWQMRSKYESKNKYSEQHRHKFEGLGEQRPFATRTALGQSDLRPCRYHARPTMRTGRRNMRPFNC